MTAGRSPAGGDVVIVGGGPVGVTAALLLARRGLPVRLYERAETVYDLPRAVGMDAEIQRIFHSAGMGAELASLTTPLAGAEFVDVDGQRIIGHEFPLDHRYTLGHHPSVMFHQPWLEEALRSAASSAGAELHFGVEVDEVVGGAESVEVQTSNGPDRAAWLIAADGAASPIRKSLNVGFVDQGFDQDWLVFDVSVKRPVAALDGLAKQICDPDRPVTMVPGHKNFYRWEFQLQPGESAAEMVKPERVWELLDRWLTPEDADLSRAVVYRFHATVAERMRVGRVFLAGDSAHQMPPFLGQGMCTGIRDVDNLAWKLALVEHGLSSDRLLDSYDTERRPHAIDMVGHAVDTGRLIDQLAGRLDSGVGLDAGYGGGREFPFLQAGLLVPGHPQVGKPLQQPLVDGVALDELLGAGFAVLGRSQPVLEETAHVWQSLVGDVPLQPVSLPAGVLEKLVIGDGVVIVRPDRYVAAVCDGQQQLAEAVASLASKLSSSSL